MTDCLLFSASGKRLVMVAMAMTLLLPVQTMAQPDANCAASESNLAWWREIANNVSEPRINADALAYDLFPCLGSTNSELRDSLGYGLYTHWLRNDSLSLETKTVLAQQLSENLESNESLLRSFSALILSEILRADANDEFLSQEQRQSMLEKTGETLLAESDYRGLDSELGWVHPVAHLADVMWRFALHPALDSQQAQLILTAVSTKALTPEAAYQFNEGDRLARVATILLQRELLSEGQWLDWLNQFQLRRNGEEWGTVFASVEGMRELHNAKLFLRALDGQLSNTELSTALRDELNAALAMLTALV